jgi:membrane-associated phospholipid phosphatase
MHRSVLTITFRLYHRASCACIFAEGIVYNSMRFLCAADRLSLFFITLLMLIALLFLPGGASLFRLLSTYLLLASALIGVAWYRRKRPGKSGFSLHILFTVALVLVLFNSVGELIAALRLPLVDHQLIRIDALLFGVHPTVWMERFINPVLTALLQFAYISYYFMPIALGVTLIVHGRTDDFEKALFGILLCFYVSYVGYILFPAVGPRFTLSGHQTTGLQAGPFITLIQETLNILEKNKTDAFPSGHTAIALVSLFYAWRMREKLLALLLVPAVSGLIISTVYLRYHYVIDVIAGVALAAGTVSLAPLLSRAISGASAYPGDKQHGCS